MNNKIVQLKLKRILSEHTYYSNEIEYKTELAREAEPNFLMEINNYLKTDPTMLESFKNTIQNVQTKIAENKIVEAKEHTKTPNSDFEKKLFREISKVAHPDKFQEEDKKLTELYVEASEAYTAHDVITLYKTAIELAIMCDVDDSVISEIEQQIEDMKEKSDFLEKNLAYQWLIAVTDDERLKVIKFYINNTVPGANI